MTRFPGTGLAAFAVVGIACVDGAMADPVSYRFEAEFMGAPVAPPPGSVTAIAAGMEKLSGTFGYDTETPRAAGASSPGRVAFAEYGTGFVTIDGIEITEIPGDMFVEITDGVPQTDSSTVAIADAVTLTTRAVSTEAPIDALTLRLRYADAERLQSVALPDALDLADMAGMGLTFSTRIDQMGTRAQGAGKDAGLLGLVQFTITAIERIE